MAAEKVGHGMATQLAYSIIQSQDVDNKLIKTFKYILVRKDNRYKSLMENQFDDDRHYIWIKKLSRVEGFS